MKLEEAVRKSRKELEVRRAELWDAETAASLTAGVSGSGGGWTDKRAALAAKEAVDAAKAAMEEASRKFEDAENALIEEMAEAEAIVKKDFRAWIIKATEEEARLTGLLQKQQAAAVATASRLVALRIVAEKMAPRRIKSRSSKKFLKVVAIDPAIKNLYPNTDPPGSLHVETFRAVRGERQGKWKIIPGQDCDPGQVEVVWGTEAIPASFEAISDINLGYFHKANGNAGKLKGEKLTARNLEYLLIDEKDLQAAAAVAERV